MWSQKELDQLKRMKEYSQCQKSINLLISLLNNKKLWAEYQLLKRMTPKIAIRLRNSPYSRSLEQLLKLVNEFKVLTQPSQMEEIKLFFDRNINDGLEKIKEKIPIYCDQIKSLMEKLFMIVILATKAFKLAQVWLDLGQLVNHFLMISCVTSRICIYSKALMVYLYDVYQICLTLQKISFPNDVCKDQMKLYILKLNIKLRAELTKKVNFKPRKSFQGSKEILSNTSGSTEIESIQIDAENIDFGVPLDRDSFKKGANDNLIINQVDNTKSKNKKRKNKATKNVISRDYISSITMPSNNGKSNAKKKAKHDIKKQATPKIAVGPGPQLSNKKKNKKRKVNSFIIE